MPAVSAEVAEVTPVVVPRIGQTFMLFDMASCDDAWQEQMHEQPEVLK